MTEPAPGGGDGNPATDPEVLLASHPHGYLVVQGGVPAAQLPPDARNWRCDTGLLPGVTVALQPRTVTGSAHGDDRSVLLLGHPVDVEAGIVDSTAIARGLLDSWRHAGEDALVRATARLGGRFTLVVVGPAGGGSELLVVPDTLATQPVFYGERCGRVALASSPSLVASTLGLPEDREVPPLMEQLRRQRKGLVSYLPGVRTAYRGVRPLIPNCLLRVGLRPDPPTPRHERFWPWTERRPSTDLDTTYAAFRDRLHAHVDLLLRLGRPALSLTAGADSRITLAAALPQLRREDGLAFTYVNPRDARARRSSAADVTGASAVASRAGVRHRVLRWRNPPPGGAFDLAHRQTFAPLLPSRGAAYAMWADLDRDLLQLQSNGAECGTTFITWRTEEPLSDERLVELLLGSRHDHLAGPLFAGYTEHAQFRADTMAGYDHHDLFYWEQRMGRWGYRKFLDGDFGHRVMAPFNDRVLLETMLSLPYPQRAGKVLYDRMLEQEPRARLPRQDPPAVDRVLSRVPGTLGSRVRGRLVRRRRATLEQRLTWPRGYAVLPARPEPSVPSWVTARASGGWWLTHHPGVAAARAGSEQAWAVVVGDPVDLDAGSTGAAAVARSLVGAMRGDGLAAASATAAALAGSWTVLLGDRTGTVLITDPAASLGAQLIGGGVVSHESLGPHLGLTGAPLRLSGTLAGRSGGAPGTDWDLLDLPDVAGRLAPLLTDPDDRRPRLVRHVELATGGAPGCLALGADPASRELLSTLADRVASGVTWWDREGGPDDARLLFEASARADGAGLPHLVVGLREDADGDAGEPGRSRRASGVRAFARTWSGRATRPDPAPVVPAGVPLDTALPAAAHLVLGTTGTAGTTERARTSEGARACWRAHDLVQGVRPVVLPLSDRRLPPPSAD